MEICIFFGKQENSHILENYTKKISEGTLISPTLMLKKASASIVLDNNILETNGNWLFNKTRIMPSKQIEALAFRQFLHCFFNINAYIFDHCICKEYVF